MAGAGAGRLEQPQPMVLMAVLAEVVVTRKMEELEPLDKDMMLEMGLQMVLVEVAGRELLEVTHLEMQGEMEE